MSDDIGYPKKPGNGKMFVGIVLLILGAGFLLQQLTSFSFPGWLFEWPTWLIIWGLFSGVRHNFRNSSWLIMVIIGLIWMPDYAFPDAHLHHIIWPIAIIAFGLWLILRRNQNLDANNWGRKWEDKWESRWSGGKYRNGNPFEPVITPVTPAGAPPADPSSPGVGSASTGSTSTGSTSIPPTGGPAASNLRGDDYIDTVSIFGGHNKTIFSKDFKGGEIVNIFGGAELDFTQADIHGRVVIDITQIFGGTKIIVPSNWKVVSDMAAVFASVDDKRIRTTATADSDKVLVLKGVSIFAGVDVRSY